MVENISYICDVSQFASREIQEITLTIKYKDVNVLIHIIQV